MSQRDLFDWRPACQVHRWRADGQALVRLEALRIFKMRRQATRARALQELDKALFRDAMRAGLTRGQSFTHADRCMAAVEARLRELEEQAGEVRVTRNVFSLPKRNGAAA